MAITMAITIVEVAKQAGVSIGTASVVLNNKKSTIRVSRETKKRIRNVARGLNYRPNIMARGLRLKKSGLIGVVSSGIETSFYPKIIQGIEDVTNKFNYSLILCTTEGKREKEESSVRLLVAKKVDGVIVIPIMGDVNLQLFYDLQKSKFPCVFVAGYLKGVPIPYVLVDGVLIGYQATKHLIELGHQNIACLGVDNKQDGRFEGYRKALKKFRITFNDDFFVDACSNWDSGYQGIQKLLLRKIKFTAVYAYDDRTALGALAALKEKGLSVPEDVSLVGSDDLDFSAMVTPSLTTVAQPKYEQGKLAAEKLFRLINGGRVRSAVLKPELKVRRTTKRIG